MELLQNFYQFPVYHLKAKTSRPEQAKHFYGRDPKNHFTNVDGKMETNLSLLYTTAFSKPRNLGGWKL